MQRYERRDFGACIRTQHLAQLSGRACEDTWSIRERADLLRSRQASDARLSMRQTGPLTHASCIRAPPMIYAHSVLEAYRFTMHELASGSRWAPRKLPLVIPQSMKLSMHPTTRKNNGTGASTATS